jgi:hypothetical protein
VNEYLSEKHERYCQEYVKCAEDRVEAAKRVGLSMSRVSTLMQDLRIRIRIQELQYEATMAARVTVNRIVAERAEMAFSDIADFVSIEDDRILIKDFSDLPAGATKLISKIKPRRHGVEIEFHSKDKALDALARYLGMYTDNFRLAGPDGGAIPIETSYNVNFVKPKKYGDISSGVDASPTEAETI